MEILKSEAKQKERLRKALNNCIYNREDPKNWKNLKKYDCYSYSDAASQIRIYKKSGIKIEVTKEFVDMWYNDILSYHRKHRSTKIYKKINNSKMKTEQQLQEFKKSIQDSFYEIKKDDLPFTVNNLKNAGCPSYAKIHSCIEDIKGTAEVSITNSYMDLLIDYYNQKYESKKEKIKQPIVKDQIQPNQAINYQKLEEAFQLILIELNAPFRIEHIGKNNPN